MKNKMSKKQLISVIIFNVAETILIYLVGRLICLPTILILTTMVLFMVTRFFFGNSLSSCRLKKSPEKGVDNMYFVLYNNNGENR